MKIAGMYSFNNGKEAITKQHRQRLEEVLQVSYISPSGSATIGTPASI